MKTRYFFLLASITGILAASCAKELNVAEEEIIETPVGQTVLTIGLPDQNKTQMEIASEIGISQAQVSRLEKNALKIIFDVKE